MPSSSSFSSSSSSSSSPSVSQRRDAEGNKDPSPLVDPDSTPLINRTDKVDAAVTREEVARRIQNEYHTNQATIQHMAVFRERHQNSQSPLEREWHHVIVQTTAACRWRRIARHLHQQEHATMHAAGVHSLIATCRQQRSHSQTWTPSTGFHQDILTSWTG